MSKFNPDDLKNPLYEHSQVVTTYDLRTIYHGLVMQHKNCKWWEIRTKYNIAVAGHAIYELMLWIQDGKPKLKEPGEYQ